MKENEKPPKQSLKKNPTILPVFNACIKCHASKSSLRKIKMQHTQY